MHPIAQKLFIDLIKPWEQLNDKLSQAMALNQTINDYITLATDLSTRIYHFPERHFSRKDLMKDSKCFSIIRDLNNSTKHGTLDNSKLQCDVKMFALIERSSEPKEMYRFSRNQIEINHATHGKFDFIQCSMDAILFIIEYFDVKTSWKPIVKASDKKFTDNVEIFADAALQVELGNWYMKFVSINEDGTISILPKPTKFQTTISHNWKKPEPLGRNFTAKQEDDGVFTIYDEINNSVKIWRHINKDQSVEWRSNDNIHPDLLKRIGRILDSSKYEKGKTLSEDDV